MFVNHNAAAGVLLITANVGSIFEEPKALISQWMAKVMEHVAAVKPHFVAIHCQEVGGKNSEKGMAHVPKFIESMRELGAEQGYDRLVAFFDGDFSAQDKFTALGSIYMVHRSLPNTDIYNFQEKGFVSLKAGQAVIKCGCIDDVDLADKHKFPLSFFPEGKWSRKGYLRTRWKLLTPSHEAAFQIFDLVNVHLFHDASNLKSVEKTPSIYVNFRERALVHTLDRVQNTFGSHELPPRAPLFIFGDFNFRLEGKSVVRKLTGDKMGASPPDAAQVMAAASMPTPPKTSDVCFFRDEGSNEVVLSIGKKEFDLRSECSRTTFSENWRHWTKYDTETLNVQNRLTEFPLGFPPTYPYEEDPLSEGSGQRYMKTRCPAWCDRVLISHDAKDNVLIQPSSNSNARQDGEEPEEGGSCDRTCQYNVIGSDVCMGDHKPVYLSFTMNLNHAS